MPSDLYLKHKGKVFRRNTNNGLNLDVGPETIQCVAVGASPEPELSLLVGGQNISEEGSECRGPGRETKCVQFEVEVKPDMNGDHMTCVASMPRVDSNNDIAEDLHDDDYVANGK